MATDRKLTRAEQKALRPQQILDAAFEEFVKNGFTGTRVEDIAARIGVTKGTVYVYFTTKEDLFAAVVRQSSQPFAEIIPYIDKIEGSYEEKLKTTIALLYEKITQDHRAREFVRFVIGEAHRFPDLMDSTHEEFVDPMVNRLSSIVAEGVKAGEFRDAPAATFMEVICGPALMMTFARVMFDNRRPIDEKRFMEAHLDMVINGLVNREGDRCSQTPTDA